MCYKNWNGTSTSMEVGIILDGFKKSLDETFSVTANSLLPA
jgi:hypothetical protein